jgi:hypothetical protein
MLTKAPEDHLTTQARLTTAIAEVMVRVQGEYHEMPGLKLTQVQAQRLWGLDDLTCGLVLNALVEQRFLMQTPAGNYVRLTE